MGLFDGMGFGSGYNNSWSRKAMRRDYITSRKEYTEAEIEGMRNGTIAGGIIGLIMLASTALYLHGTQVPHENCLLKISTYQKDPVSIINNDDAAIPKIYQRIEEKNTQKE